MKYIPLLLTLHQITDTVNTAPTVTINPATAQTPITHGGVPILYYTGNNIYAATLIN